MSAWIDAKKQLPPDLERVLLYDPTFDEHPVHVGFFDLANHKFQLIDEGGWDSRSIGEVTHWQHMPDAPTE